MVRTHFYSLNPPGVWINQLPGLTVVLATPKAGGLYIDDVLVGWIKDEKLCHTPQVEHSPGLPSVMRDVGTGHIASDQHGVGIMRADLRTEHGATAAGSNDFEIAGSL
jgi:hypothetical protein